MSRHHLDSVDGSSSPETFGCEPKKNKRLTNILPNILAASTRVERKVGATNDAAEDLL